MFALRASDVRLRRVNFIRQPILGSGPKMDAGANVGVTQTAVSNFCPKQIIEAEQ